IPPRSVETPTEEVSMRKLLALVAVVWVYPLAAHADNASDRFNEKTVAELQSMMQRGRLTSVELTQFYINRILKIDQKGGVNAVIELNPDALKLARLSDLERKFGIDRGPLMGIPVLLKDNIDTGDKMQTTAGSLTLVGTPALQDSTVAAHL